MSKGKQDFIASRNILRANIRLFHEGHPDLYRVVATELRKLLCDRQSALLPRLFSQMRLHPTRSYRPGEDLTNLTAQIPAAMEFDGKGGVKVLRMFDKSRQPIPLEEWLGQPFLSAKVTVREFIRSVANKEGAHADPKFNETLLCAKGIGLAGQELVNVLIVAIGEYLLEVLDMAVEANPDHFPK